MANDARDTFAAPLRGLDQVLKAIGEGSFDPDSTRSGQWKDLPPGMASQSMGEVFNEHAPEDGESGEEEEGLDEEASEEEVKKALLERNLQERNYHESVVLKPLVTNKKSASL